MFGDLQAVKMCFSREIEHANLACQLVYLLVGKNSRPVLTDLYEYGKN